MTQPTGIRDKKRPAGRKLTKADISQPTNFKHLAHVGWNDSKRFELNSEEVNSLDTFLKKAGVSEQQLNDRDTRAYIYDFIQSHNVLDSVISEKQQQAPPPVPTRNVSDSIQLECDRIGIESSLDVIIVIHDVSLTRFVF